MSKRTVLRRNQQGSQPTGQRGIESYFLPAAAPQTNDEPICTSEFQRIQFDVENTVGHAVSTFEESAISHDLYYMIHTLDALVREEEQDRAWLRFVRGEMRAVKAKRKRTIEKEVYGTNDAGEIRTILEASPIEYLQYYNQREVTMSNKAGRMGELCE